MRAANLPSSLIARIVWDERTRRLQVRFRDGRAYVYFDVPRAVYDGFKAAPSAGRFYNEAVKGRFRCAFDPERRRFRPHAA